jgi:hypothetical protein
MGPYKNIVYKVGYSGLNRKRQVIDQVLNDLHTMQMDMIESAVQIREGQGFPEAREVIDYIRSL